MTSSRTLYTLPLENYWLSYCFLFFGSEAPQAGQTLSSTLIRRVSLHIGHLTGRTLTILTSRLGYKLLWLFLSPVDVVFSEMI